MSKTDYAENKVNELLVGKTAFTLPTAYIALFTAAPNDTGGGTEVTGGAYARKATAASDWAASSGGSIANSTVQTFPTATAAWGTITHYAIMDAATAGNMLFYGSITTPKAIANGDTASFAVGAIVHTED